MRAKVPNFFFYPSRKCSHKGRNFERLSMNCINVHDVTVCMYMDAFAIICERVDVCVFVWVFCLALQKLIPTVLKTVQLSPRACVLNA